MFLLLLKKLHKYKFSAHEADRSKSIFFCFRYRGKGHTLDKDYVDIYYDHRQDMLYLLIEIQKWSNKFILFEYHTLKTALSQGASQVGEKKVI